MNKNELPPALRFEIYLVSAFLIAFGIANQTGQAWFELTSAERLIEVPAGATVLPGLFLGIAGIGAFLRQEWGFKLGSVLCLMHLTVSAITWPLSRVETAYVILCAVGAAACWRVLVLYRRTTAAPDESSTSVPKHE